MQGLSTTAPRDFAVASGIVGDAYVASLAVVITGDGTSRRVDVDGKTFEDLLTTVEMRMQGFEPRTRAFRPHTVKAVQLVQRIDRLWPAIERVARDSPRLAKVADQVRDLAELSDAVSWRLA